MARGEKFRLHFAERFSPGGTPLAGLGHRVGGSACDCAFFFFQAEDGIRDYKVTGVQTCALPIYSAARPSRACGSSARRCRYSRPRSSSRHAMPQFEALLTLAEVPPGSMRARVIGEIGRASCRERV